MTVFGVLAGYKAGALREGLASARGEFVAVFCASGLLLLCALGRDPLNPFLILYAVGFAAVSARSIRESLRTTVRAA
jgi:hypothetical protein